MRLDEKRFIYFYHQKEFSRQDKRDFIDLDTTSKYYLKKRNRGNSKKIKT